ncbi:MAG: hypothetical protein RJQ04_05335 [Longimicrobiales bacterium]
MGRLIWRGWAAACLLAGAVVAPLFLEVFSGGSPLRFLALPLRYAWIVWLVLPILAEGWLRPRAVAVALLGFATVLSGVILSDLATGASVHPGWFLTLEWWQRPLYPWLDLLPPWTALYRPGYLWTLATWNLVEAAVLAALAWRWSSRTGGPALR